MNVHPSKMEIRIHHGNELYEELSTAVAGCLHEVELIPDVKLVQEEDKPEPPLKTPEPFEVRRTAMLREEEADYHTKAEQPKMADFLQKMALNRVIGETNTVKTMENAGIHANVIKAGEHILVEKPVQLDLFEERFLSEDARENYQILGQIFDTYWLIAFKDKLFIMDQHAAHEKVKYERLVKELEEKTVSSQMLNPPVILSLTGREEQLLKEFADSFRELGFELEEFGAGSYAIRSMPVDLYGCNEKEFFMDILDEIAENPMKGKPDVILHKLASMACKAAVKGNMHMTVEEVGALLDALLELQDPYHCPHGRPTIISMTKYEIEKKFKRIV